MRFSWTKGRSMMVVSAALMALQGVPTALAQFVPYGGNQTQGYNQYQAYSAQQAQPQYVARAFQGSETRGGSPTLSQPMESIAPGQVQRGVSQAAPVQAAPMQVQNYSSAPAAGCNCQQQAPAVNYSQPAPVYSQPAATSYPSYPAASGGYASSSCNTYNTLDAGSGVGASYGGNYLGVGGGRRGNRQWFGGVYGLYMERDGNPWKALAFSTAAANPAGYYPADNEFVVNLTDIDNDTFAGAEVRFGATFGGGGCGSCGPRYAWEVAYWGLDEDDTSFVATDLVADANRLYGMIDYRGLEYDSGAGYRPVNDYFDYGPPTEPDTVGADVIRVRSITARNVFSMQNMELNLLRMSVLSGGTYRGAGVAGGAGFGGRGLGSRGLGGRRGGFGGGAAGGCGTGYGSCGAGGCDSGGCSSCAGGGCASGSCGVSSCGTGCGPRYSVTGLFGVRYLRVDEDFMFRADFENETTPGLGFLSHNIDVDNHLVGAQLGFNGIYRMGCSGRWALHCNTVVGVYNNHTEVWNRMDSPTGNLRFANGGNESFDLRYEDDDIAMIGELRAGVSYQYSCNWRLFSGYRATGISGVALAFDQIQPSQISPSQVSYVDSDGSIFLHGLQAGVEFTY